ncbi:MAG: LemA family protein [Chloroflexota bacterium]
MSYARNYYNSRVLSYNGLVQMVPSNYVAKLGGFAESEFFEASEEGRDEVKVGFG